MLILIFEHDTTELCEKPVLKKILKYLGMTVIYSQTHQKKNVKYTIFMYTHPKTCLSTYMWFICVDMLHIYGRKTKRKIKPMSAFEESGERKMFGSFLLF